MKKPYKVSLRDAWYMFDEKAMKVVGQALLDDGWTQKDIDARKYYDFPFFRQRVQRIVPPPSILYP